MRIREIQAKYYRTLKDIKLSFSPNYCTISGKNNAGKSGIIRLLINLLGQEDSRLWLSDDYSFDYTADITQWMSNDVNSGKESDAIPV